MESKKVIDLGFDMCNVRFDDIPKVLAFLVKNVMELNQKVDKLIIATRNNSDEGVKEEEEDKLAEITQKLEILGQMADFKPKHNDDSWMSVQELCDYLPSHPVEQTIYAWTSNRKIPFHKVGKKIQFLQSEIDTWLVSKNTKEELKTEATIDDEVNEYIKRKNLEEKQKHMRKG